MFFTKAPDDSCDQQDGGSQQPGQGMAAGTGRAGDQIKMGGPSPAQAADQIVLQLPVAQKRFKAHCYPPSVF